MKTVHRFQLSDNDETKIRAIHGAFFRYGLRISSEGPDYASLMTLTDADGRNWSFLASNDNFSRVRAMHEKNLIVPLVGDFAGPKTLRMVGQYVRDRGAIVNVFYVSNVENYLKAPLIGVVGSPTWDTWVQNVASLPINESSLFIRWLLGSFKMNWIDSIPEFVRTGGGLPPQLIR